jgi:hypothetical protein
MHLFVRGARLPVLAALLPFVLCATFFACDVEEVNPSHPAPQRADDPSGANGAATPEEPPPAGETMPSDPGPSHEHDMALELTITSPVDGAVVELPPSGHLPIAFETNLEIQKPKGCGSSEHPNHCGHAHITVDGAACNAPRVSPDGGAAGKQTYNVMAVGASSKYADFTFCPQPVDGPHVIEIELRQDNHAPLNPVVKRSVTVIVSAPDGGFTRGPEADGGPMRDAGGELRPDGGPLRDAGAD